MKRSALRNLSRSAASTVGCWLALAALSVGVGAQAAVPTTAEREAAFYRIVTVPVPPDLVLEVGGLAIRSDGRVFICTRRGEIHLVDGLFGADPNAVRFRRFAQGLAEPLGLLERDGWLYCAQRGELSRLADRDGDDVAEILETVSDAWRISGNYHEYNFGPVVGPDGRLWITTNKPFGDEPFGRADWRGFAVAFEADGTLVPLCSGLRSPAGLASSPDGELFYTDNQGEWCGASKLSHLSPGDFHGHPWGLPSCRRPEWTFPIPSEPPGRQLFPDVARARSDLKLPAVWFPYDKMGKSPCGFAWDTTGGAFGPFSGQIFVGDQHHAAIYRVSLERVGGHWQGACHPFRENLQCGVTRVAFGPDGSLLVGQTNRGWASRGSVEQGLERLVYSGLVPFEILSMSARPDGFRLRLTRPLHAASAGGASFRMESYTYLLHQDYGSDEVEKRELAIREVRFSSDRLTVDLVVDGLRAGFVHELRADGLRDERGEPLLHALACYTLINVPGGEHLQKANDARPTGLR